VSGEELLYVDDAGRLRNSRGQFAAYATDWPTPDEVCPNGCERFGYWWVPVDCAKHLGGC
jgi:hypothetical protein